MTSVSLPNHLTLTGRPLLLMPSVLNELHARLKEAYSPRTAPLADRLFRRAKPQTEPAAKAQVEAQVAARVLASRISLASSPAPAITRPDPYFAHIQIEGPLLNKAAMMGEMVCVDGYDRIEADIEAAFSDKDCAGILLDIDSPGGMVNGCFELSDKIGVWAKDKPILVHTSGLLCSAAYALAAQCTEIHAALTATTGSIGVIYGRYDWSAALKKEGVKVDYITSGARKSWGHPETEMSETEHTALQDEIDTLAGLFFDRVSAGRALTVDAVKALEAGAYLTCAAIDHGLVNSMTDRSGAVARLAELAANPEFEPHPAPAAPDPAALQRAAPLSTANKETPMSKSIARHRASLSVMLLACAGSMALKLASGADEDELNAALEDETGEELDAMEDEDIVSMDEDDGVAAVEEDDDLEAMDEDEITAAQEDDDTDDKTAFKTAASRIARRAAGKMTAAKPAAPTGDPVKDAVTAERNRNAAIMALPETQGREALAAKLSAKGLSAEDAKDILAASPKAPKRAFNPASPKLGVEGTKGSKNTAGDDLIAAAKALGTQGA